VGRGGATGGASLVGPKERVGSFSKEGEGSASLRCGGIVEETELGVDAPSVEDLLAGARHALADPALLQVGGQGKAPVAQGLPAFS
jgi:hypothetical protein